MVISSVTLTYLGCVITLTFLHNICHVLFRNQLITDQSATLVLPRRHIRSCNRWMVHTHDDAVQSGWSGRDWYNRNGPTIDPCATPCFSQDAYLWNPKEHGLSRCQIKQQRIRHSVGSALHVPTQLPRTLDPFSQQTRGLSPPIGSEYICCQTTSLHGKIVLSHKYSHG